MNSKIIISISAIITIIIVIFSLTQIQMVEKETPQQIEENDQINAILENIKQEKIKNDNSDNPYIPKEREWITAGPFSIDRSEYVLGEKIFINVGQIPKNLKGTMILSKILNSTHSYEYKKIKFDGSKPQQNFYTGFTLNSARGICTVDQLIGDWEMIFEGTPIKSIKFKVKNEIIPGMEKFYQKAC